MLLSTPFTAADGPEYIKRTKTPFTIPDIDMAALRKAIPNEAFTRSTSRALTGILPIFIASFVFWAFAWNIDSLVHNFLAPDSVLGQYIKGALWLFYWITQGIVWSGFFSIGHEADHDNLSSTAWINHTIGLIAHTWIFMPYFSFRLTHLRHHKTVGQLELEEVYVPHRRPDYGLPPAHEAKEEHYMEAFAESPAFLLLRFLVMQFLGLPTYFTWNTLGSTRYPEGSNHWNAYSGLWDKRERAHVHASNAAIGTMITFLCILARYTSWSFVCKIYVAPYFLTNHWVIAMTFLQHSCPTVPFYRGDTWTRARGSLSSIDRPFLGWVDGVVFLHVNRYHTVHHLFAKIPFYNLPMAHEAILPLLGSAYNFDSTGILRALWRSFTHCLFVEDEGNIVFFKDTAGNAHRVVSAELDE